MIYPNGYWKSDDAHTHHVFSPSLAQQLTWLLLGISDTFKVHDFGAGLGDYALVLSEDGFDCVAFEGDPSPKAVFPLVKQDLTEPMEFEPREIGICLEVMEHIPPGLMDKALDNILGLTEKWLILSWAIRGQAGYGHVNCLNNGEVKEILKGRGFEFCPLETVGLRNGYTVAEAPWFFNTLMVFKRDENTNI